MTGREATRCTVAEGGSTCTLGASHGPVHVGPRGDGTYGRWTARAGRKSSLIVSHDRCPDCEAVVAVEVLPNGVWQAWASDGTRHVHDGPAGRETTADECAECGVKPAASAAFPFCGNPCERSWRSRVEDASSGREPSVCSACGKPPEGRCPESENTLHVLPVLVRQATEDCIACAGSGCYDDEGSPPCDACNGTGQREEGQ